VGPLLAETPNGVSARLGDPLDVLADREHLACRLVAEDLSAWYLVVVPLAVALLGVPVAPAEPAGLDSDDCTVRRRIGCLDGSYRERFAVLLEDCCAHLGSARTVAAGDEKPWRRDGVRGTPSVPTSSVRRP